MAIPTHSEAMQLVAAHERAADLALWVRDCLYQAADASTLELEAEVARTAAERGIGRDQAQTPLGNAMESLGRLRGDRGSAAVLTALLGHALKLEPPQGVDAEDKAATRLAWLSSWTSVDALSVLDEALETKAEGLWGALADLVQRHDARAVGGRAEALVAAAALASSGHPTARTRAAELATQVRDPVVLRLLAGGGEGPAQAPVLRGELSRAPRGPVVTFLLAASGWLLAANVARVLGRLALKYGRPAEVTLTPRGVLVRGRTELMGKVLKEHQVLIPLEGLVRATREVRFPRLGTYAGLAALALGSYLGVSWFIDGVRAASFSLIAVGMLVILLGIGLDFALSSLLPGRKGKCRVMFVPTRGATVCLAQVQVEAADSTLAALARR